MNKFVQNLTQSGDGIKQQRAELLGSQAKTAQSNLVNRLTNERDTLKLQLDSLQDLSPDTTISLKPGGDNFNAGNWVNQIQNLKVQLLNKEIELKVANDTYTEWFGEASENAEG
jgi:hypothetical protein